MRKNFRLCAILLAVLMVLGSMNGVLALSKETEKIIAPGTYSFTYVLDFEQISPKYASAQFNITVSDKNQLDITSIVFDSAIKSKAGGVVSTLSSGGEVSGNQVLYKVGFLSTDNQYGSETSICTITFNYTGSASATVRFDNLEVYSFTGKITNGIPELQKQTPDWSRTIKVSRSTDTPPTQKVTSPTASPAAGTYSSAQRVTLTGEAGATIYYTTNGSSPSTSSTRYTGAITVGNSMTIKAFAVKDGYLNSDVSSFSYIIQTSGGEGPTQKVSSPTASPAAGTYSAAQRVTLTGKAGATIYYTTNETSPSTSSTRYTGAITVDKSMTIKAFAVKDGYLNSDIASFSYIIQTGDVNPPADSLSVKITGTTNTSTGKTSGTLSSAAAAGLADNAKKAESEGKEAVVEITMETTSSTKSAEIIIPRGALNTLATQTDAELKIKTGIGTVTFDAEAVESINSSKTSGDIKVEITKVDAYSLNDSLRLTIGDHPVYDFSVSAGGTPISSFGEGNAHISIPYTLKQGEDKNAVIIYYIDDTGALQTVRGAYNSDTGTVDFTVSHFSKYAVGYKKVSFKDVESGMWYYNPVTFIAARGITNGTGPDEFNPEARLTRAQFIVMLMRAYGISPDVNPTDNFSDAGDTYYTDYLAVAKRLGISNGVGNNKYEPESFITRQDMFTLLYRSLKLLGELPGNKTGRTLSMFGDSGLVATYAVEAMDALVKGGIVNGSDGMLNPNGYSTRAEMAQVLYNLLSA